jgi:uncharacterized protein YdhG (YjbR/CyaY superfamily)
MKKNNSELIEKQESLKLYFEKQTNEAQMQLRLLESLILKTVPTAIPYFSYSMPTYLYKGKVLIYFAAWKTHIGLYPAGNFIANFKDDLIGFKTTKGSIHLPINDKLPVSFIKKIIKFKLNFINNKL